MKFKVILITIILLISTFLPAAAEELKVGFVSDIGGIGDKSYNDQLLESFKKLENDFNFKFESKESELMTEYLDNINYFAENNFDLIWGVAFTMEQAIKEAAQLYPEINFVIFDAVVEEENVLSIEFKEEEAGFLAGLTAALENESSKVAFVGGRENSEILKYQNGFKVGVETVNSKIEVINKYIGSFNNYSKAKKTVSELVEEDVDLIFYAAGAAGRGIIEVAVENDIKLISLDLIDKILAPQNMITIILKNTDEIVAKTLENFYNDNYVNEIKKYGIAENAFKIDLDQAEKMMSSSSINKIEEYKKQLLIGEIEIP